jgi:hypothetical protein
VKSIGVGLKTYSTMMVKDYHIRMYPTAFFLKKQWMMPTSSPQTSWMILDSIWIPLKNNWEAKIGHPVVDLMTPLKQKSPAVTLDLITLEKESVQDLVMPLLEDADDPQINYSISGVMR